MSRATCKHCQRQFGDANALGQHVRSKHGKLSVKQAAPLMDPRLAMEIVDDMDLPDGAYWAMLEDMTGLEPADFAFLADSE